MIWHSRDSHVNVRLDVQQLVFHLSCKTFLPADIAAEPRQEGKKSTGPHRSSCPSRPIQPASSNSSSQALAEQSRGQSMLWRVGDPYSPEGNSSRSPTRTSHRVRSYRSVFVADTYTTDLATSQRFMHDIRYATTPYPPRYLFGVHVKLPVLHPSTRPIPVTRDLSFPCFQLPNPPPPLEAARRPQPTE
ncbi:unnamed protein product [Alternaria burnsii]|nr:unnamed protein product [Alternaria burnsii]